MLACPLVSSLHHKYEFEGHHLDAAYISPQLIASATPTESYFQSIYRTPLSLFIEFLTTNHGAKWHIWNLQEDHEPGYDPESVRRYTGRDALSRVPIPDHTPPPLATLRSTAQAIDAWLQQDPENVAVIHCKCGKGRTGTIICAYLILFAGMTPEQAREQFRLHRIRAPFVDGVSIAGQKRFLRYLSEPLWDESPPLKVTHVIIHGAKFAEYELGIFPLAKMSSVQAQWHKTVKVGIHVLQPANEVTLPADLSLEFSAYLFGVPVSFTRFPFNTSFELAGKVICKWVETDGPSGFPVSGVRAYDEIEVHWRPVNAALQELSSTNTTKRI